LDKDILNILINRKIDSKEKISHFFDNSMESLQNPFLLKDVEKTINRILTAIENNEKFIFMEIMMLMESLLPPYLIWL